LRVPVSVPYAGAGPDGGLIRLRRPKPTAPPSSSGLGHRPFKAAARVRIPLGARPDQQAARAPAAMRWKSPSRTAPHGTARNPGRHRARGLEMASQLIYAERAGRLAFATGFSHTAQPRSPAPRGSYAYRHATLFSRSHAAQPWSGAVIGGLCPRLASLPA